MRSGRCSTPISTRRRIIVIAATAAGSAFVTGGRTAQAGDPGAAVRIGTRRTSLDRDLSPGPDRGQTACCAVRRRTRSGWSSSSACTPGPTRPDLRAVTALRYSGVLPHAEMLAPLKASLFLAGSTDSAFDPTVQPLWQLYADHFSSERPDLKGPRPRGGRNAREVGRNRLLVECDRVALVAACRRGLL